MSERNKEYVLVTEYFHPDTASTGQLMTDLAVGLCERGLDMTVYTGQPNYHSGDNERQPRRSIHEGVPVRRIRAPQVRQTSLVRRLFNWVAFTLWMVFVLLFSRPEGDREVVFVSNPPFLPIAMWVVCELRGWEYTYVVYDLYPDVLSVTGYITEGGMVDSVWSALHRYVFGGANHVVALGPAMRDRIAKAAGPGFDAAKVCVIQNWADGDTISPMEKSENWFVRDHDLEEPFTLLYSGNIGENHDLETVLEAASRLDDEEVVVVIIGEGDKKREIVQSAERRGIRGSRVRFLPYQPLEDLPYSLTAGDASIVTVQKGMEGLCVSSKLYTALAAGRPILVIAQPHDDEARIVEAFDAGISVGQGEANAAVEAVRAWVEDPDLVRTQGRNARRAFERYCTEEIAIDRYYRLLSDAESVDEDPVVGHLEGAAFDASRPFASRTD